MHNVGRKQELLKENECTSTRSGTAKKPAQASKLYYRPVIAIAASTASTHPHITSTCGAQQPQDPQRVTSLSPVYGPAAASVPLAKIILFVTRLCSRHHHHACSQSVLDAGHRAIYPRLMPAPRSRLSTASSSCGDSAAERTRARGRVSVWGVWGPLLTLGAWHVRLQGKDDK